MSLLMDALKKAEQEKKEAAKRQQEFEGATEGENLQSQQKTLDDTDTWGHEIAEGSKTAEIPAMHSTTARLELEPISSADDTAEIPVINTAVTSGQEAEDPTLNVTMNELSMAEFSAAGLDADDAEIPDQTSIEELQTENADLLDETFHGVSLESGEFNPELFQETVQGEAFLPDDASQTYGETLPGIPAAQLAEDIGSDDQPTPVAAQTVFTATGTTRSSGPGFKWILGGLCSLALVAGVVWYYITITPMNRSLQSPQIAQGIERVGPPLHETLELNIKPVPGQSQGEPATVLSTQNLSGTLASEEASNSPAINEQEETAAIEQTDIEVVDELEKDPGFATAAMDSDPADGGSQGTGMATSLPENIATEPSLFKISRSKTPDDKSKVINDAYFAYQKGAYGTATEKYRQVLKEFPDNRDALLGLGAIASNNADYESAFDFYSRLLKVNPGDQYAKAALINLQDNSVLLNSESTINSMLHASPGDHFLHFTLGNIYAAGSRWAEAQQAFFDAYRLNSGNPDYAVNLAISLDHIGQHEAALDYYNVALELSGNNTPMFDSSPVRKRINDLNQVAER